MAASRKHWFDTRWPCARADSSPAVPKSEPQYEGLHLVPVEPDTADLEPEEAGTQRLLAAMAAVRASAMQTRRDPWL